MPRRQLIRQVLVCPICGRSGTLDRFNIDSATGEPATERIEHLVNIKMQHVVDGVRGTQWTTHPIPVRVLRALRQQLVEALDRIDGALNDVE